MYTKELTNLLKKSDCIYVLKSDDKIYVLSDVMLCVMDALDYAKFVQKITLHAPPENGKGFEIRNSILSELPEDRHKYVRSICNRFKPLDQQGTRTDLIIAKDPKSKEAPRPYLFSDYAVYVSENVDKCFDFTAKVDISAVEGNKFAVYISSKEKYAAVMGRKIKTDKLKTDVESLLKVLCAGETT